MNNETFLEYLKKLSGEGKEPSMIRPFVHYYQDGDFLEAYWKNESAYADPIVIPGKGEIMALMRSIDTKEVIGIQIFWVDSMIEKTKEGKKE